MPKSPVDTQIDKLTRLRDSGKKWREIGDEFPGVPLGTLCRIYKDKNYEPRRPDIRAALGLPRYLPAPVCPHCGNVPLSKRCPCRRKPSTAPRRDWLLDSRESLAALAHEQWSGWMQYLFSKCKPDGKSVIIPAAFVDRWVRQMDTPYADLPENEKESDRVEADKVISVASARRRGRRV